MDSLINLIERVLKDGAQKWMGETLKAMGKEVPIGKENLKRALQKELQDLKAEKQRATEDVVEPETQDKPEEVGREEENQEKESGRKDTSEKESLRQEVPSDLVILGEKNHGSNAIHRNFPPRSSELAELKGHMDLLWKRTGYQEEEKRAEEQAEKDYPLVETKETSPWVFAEAVKATRRAAKSLALAKIFHPELVKSCEETLRMLENNYFLTIAKERLGGDNAKAILPYIGGPSRMSVLNEALKAAAQDIKISSKYNNKRQREDKCWGCGETGHRKHECKKQKKDLEAKKNFPKKD